MAIIGQSLTIPESGWQRFDDRNNNLTYSSGWFQDNGSCYYNSTGTTCKNLINETLKFNFIGTKLRIIGLGRNSLYSTNVSIQIDTIQEHFTCIYPTINQCILYEKIGLTNKEHIVTITTTDTYYFAFDAIDIDSTGQLKQYNIINHKFLIQDGNRIKTSTDGINLIDLGTTYDQTIFNTYGMNDLSLLNSTTLNKIINNQYKILMYKV